MQHDRTDYRSYCERGDEETDAELSRGDFAVLVANLEALRMRAEKAEGELAAYKQAISEAEGLSHDFSGKGSCLDWIKRRAAELPPNA